MSNFKDIINKYNDKIIRSNDKRILIEAINLLDDEPILTDTELNVLKEIFMALKEDYTLDITQDREQLEFMVEIQKQDVPIIENKHDLNELCNELIQSTNCQSITQLESVVITFLCACEHIEENEICIIKEIIKLIEKNWTLSPIIQKEKNGKIYRYTKFVPTYSKQLVKKNSR